MKSSSIAKNTLAGITLIAVLFGSGLQMVFADTSAILIPSNFTFNTNLTLGSVKSPDVSYLQRFLNNDPRTKLTETDPCIYIPSTNTFDTRTRNAVIKFQNLYKSEVLTPAGLTAGTGNLGIYTRAKINQLLLTPQYSQIIASTTIITATTSQSTTTNTQNSQQTATNTSALKPTISSVYPQVLTNCLNTVTIIGRNFDPNENYLISTIGYLKASSSPYFTGTAGTSSTTNQTSDLRVITFNIKQFSNYDSIQSLYAGTSQVIGIRVQNYVNGKTSDDTASIRYTFPGTKSASTLPNLEQYSIPFEIPAGAAQNGANSNNGNSNSGNSNNTGAAVAVVAGVVVAGALISGGTEAAAAGTTAVSPSATLNFGGPIVGVYTCTCSGNQLVSIQDVRGMNKQLIFQPGVSRLYQYYNLRAGVNSLGTYVGGGQCLMYAVVGCSTYGAPIGTITQIGTSKGI